MNSDNTFSVPIELKVGDTSAQVAEMTVTADPHVWRPRLATVLRALADEFDPTKEGPDE